MRLEKIQRVLEEKGIVYTYAEEDGCGSIDFLFRGIPYHIWEFQDGEWGAESNVENSGKSRDVMGDYEEEISAVIRSWPG